MPKNRPATISKEDIRRYAYAIALSTSHGTKLDPEALFKRLWKQTRRCILCGKPSYLWSLFYPGEHSDPILRTGLSRGQSRAFAYGVCVKCWLSHEDDLPRLAGRVEDKIADAHTREANIRAQLDAAGVPYTNEAMPDGTRWILLGDADQNAEK